MRTFKSEVNGVGGSELLSVLMRPDTSRPELEESVAQVVAMRVGSGDVTTLVLAPKTAFEVELQTIGERTPLTVETAVLEGDNYDWFERWDRMMVLRPKSGPPSDKRAEAGLLAALRRRLTRSVPLDNPMAACAMDALCMIVFGESVNELYRILKGEVAVDDRGYEMQRLDNGDDVSIGLTRPVNVSELQELLEIVPKEWRPVLQRSAVKTVRCNTSGEDVEAGRPTQSTRPAFCSKTIAIGSVMAALIFFGGVYALRHATKTTMRRMAVCPSFEDPRNRELFRWSPSFGEQQPCGSGTVICGKLPQVSYCRDFGSPLTVTFPRVVNKTRKFKHPPGYCAVLCHSPADTRRAFATNLLKHFPDQGLNMSRLLSTHFENRTKSREDELLAGLPLDPNCSGSTASWRELGNLTNCICDVANVSCDVLDKYLGATLRTVLTDFKTPLTRVSSSFADYPEGDSYECSGNSIPNAPITNG
ncbi:putative transmembrane protein [Gregarina niphandrodes]|uniref:Transmembrane protein n=1 Tax=Gregarina niphandrodes TaxID=110365 RepID=A0A023AZC8_GRENI|nr:putative transmembrane protein [Gregarina niphandrodes]EZG44013.1 putative transmembrane protein [Gregarina niphandrodes]|eukprot:XP_011132846.1 putative transmembrane protein [Gregarina niphandrodes]